MFVSINWIKDYVDLDGLDIKKLIESLQRSIIPTLTPGTKLKRLKSVLKKRPRLMRF